jgi:uncharacterized protein involved in exopolysaccharide biosynthesis
MVDGRTVVVSYSRPDRRRSSERLRLFMATTPLRETAPPEPDAPHAPSAEGDALRSVARHVLRSWWLILLLAIIAGGAAAAYEKSRSTDYRTSALMLFSDPSYEALVTGSGYNPVDTQRRARTNVQLIGLARVAVDAARRAGHGVTVGEILSGVHVTASAESDLMQVAAESDSNVRAAAMANGVAAAYLNLRSDLSASSLKSTRAVLKRQLKDAATDADEQALQSQLNKLDALESLQNRELRVVQPAFVPGTRIATQPKRYGAIGAVVGALLGIALALVRRPRRKP